MVKFRIAAVPEHFTLPIQLGNEKGFFQKHLDQTDEVDIQEFPKGTGSMCLALREKQVEIAIALTEGLVSDRIKNQSNFRIVGTYVQSPLQWATVIKKGRTDLKYLADIKGTRVGISRNGSGSHIMSFVLANNEKFNGHELSYVPCGGMESLVQAVEQDKVDSFMWETFTIRDAVQSDRVQYLGYTTTPWPCFMIAVREDILQQYPQQIKGILKGIRQSCHHFCDNQIDSLATVAKKCRLNNQEAKEWYGMTEFSKDSSVQTSVLDNVMDTLIHTKALPKDSKVPISELVDTKICNLKK